MVETVEEQQWIEDSRNGDHAAFESLIRRYQQMIHSVTYRMTGSMADAEDLAQETFIRAFQQMTSYRGEAKFSSWLCRVAVNACLNWRTREGRREEVHRKWAIDSVVEETGQAPATDEGDESRRVQAALGRLPEKQRAAIVLTVYEQLNHAEAAKILGCSETTVSWRVFAARNKLKRWLQPAARPEPGR